MDKSRRHILTSFFSGFTLSCLSHQALAQNKTYLNSDEQKTIGFMKERGIEHFQMLNKKRGQILFISYSEIIHTTPALSGRIKGDKHREDLGTTPAGIYILRPYGDNKSIGFEHVDGTKIDYAIHTIPEPLKQSRGQRLESNQPDWQRISAGCVNVSQDTINIILAFAQNSQFYRDETGSIVVGGSFFVVLPEYTKVETIFKTPTFKLPTPEAH